ncbi:MAG: hypothetical protein LBS96_10130 [Oscillospiraceae bacterium]|jgi:ComF family protein|nr:hypothetical protein [Oscillospiraceae bacterium]
MKNQSAALRRLLLLWERALFWIFPRRCAWCGGVTEPDCALCTDCAVAGEGALSSALADAVRVFSCYQYRSPARRQFSQLKFYGKRGLAPSLGRTMAECLRQSAAPQFDGKTNDWLVTAVPMTQTQQRARKYNQSLLLARAVARQLGAQFAPNLLQKTRETGTQHGLPARARKANVADAFSVGEPNAARGRRVVLCDDVVTTGATLRVCADALRAAGAAEVICLTLLQTVQTYDIATHIRPS